MSKSKLVRVRSNLAGAMAPVTLHVNGDECVLPNGEEVEVEPHFAEAARNSGYDVTIFDDEQGEEQGAPNGAAVGEAGGPSLTDGQFDAAAIVAGNVADAVKALAGLTAEQLDAVEAAEKASDKPRQGVLNAIAEAKQA